MNKSLVGIILVATGLLCIVTLYGTRQLLATTPLVAESMLSLVVGMEVRLAKQWQEQGAFTKDLTEGVEGADVRLLQSYLAHEKQLLSSSDITGYYGPKTKQAVAILQVEQGLAARGMVDEATRKFLNTTFARTVCPVSTQKKLPYATPVTRSTGIPTSYIPPGLVVLEGVPTKGTVCLEEATATAAKDMILAAADEGVILRVTSGYRRPEIQQLLLDFWVALQGESAYNEVALPGHSEHQLGTTVDLTGRSIGNVSVSELFADSPEYAWLTNNAAAYGFSLSYGASTDKRDGYVFEPWHWRYTGH
jgi:LAS superfamily LD-carboxypeptidase LdcB